MVATMVGGWTEYHTNISPEEMEVFETALGGLDGVTYYPLAVSTQVVAGMNYSFFCNAQVVYPNAPNEAAMVNIYNPLDGEPHITSIDRINH